MSENLKTPYYLSFALAALMGVLSILGLLFQELYRDVDWIRLVWFGNDWVTLLVAVPLLIAGQPTPLEPESFKVVAAIDITIIVTALIFGGVCFGGEMPGDISSRRSPAS